MDDSCERWSECERVPSGNNILYFGSIGCVSYNIYNEYNSQHFNEAFFVDDNRSKHTRYRSYLSSFIHVLLWLLYGVWWQAGRGWVALALLRYAHVHTCANISPSSSGSLSRWSTPISSRFHTFLNSPNVAVDNYWWYVSYEHKPNRIDGVPAQLLEPYQTASQASQDSPFRDVFQLSCNKDLKNNVRGCVLISFE